MAQLALHGGQTAKTKPFPSWPQYDEREERALLSVLHSQNWWRDAGDKTSQFEKDFAAAHGAKHGIACTNGTHALEICIAALGIGQGDEVIVPNFTFVATASAVLSAGALPVLIDVSPQTYCLNAAQVEAAITPQTRAIITVHMGGCVDHVDELAAVRRAASYCPDRRLRARPRQRMEGAARRRFWHRRDVQLPAEQVDDRRRGRSHHH